MFYDGIFFLFDGIMQDIIGKIWYNYIEMCRTVSKKGASIKQLVQGRNGQNNEGKGNKTQRASPQGDGGTDKQSFERVSVCGGDRYRGLLRGELYYAGWRSNTHADTERISYANCKR